MHKKIGLELLQIVNNLAQLGKIGNKERIYAVKCIKEYINTADPESIEILLDDVLIYKIDDEKQKEFRNRIHNM